MSNILQKFSIDFNPITTWKRLDANEKCCVILYLMVLFLIFYFRNEIMNMLCGSSGVFSTVEKTFSEVYDTISSPCSHKTSY